MSSAARARRAPVRQQADVGGVPLADAKSSVCCQVQGQRWMSLQTCQTSWQTTSCHGLHGAAPGSSQMPARAHRSTRPAQPQICASASAALQPGLQLWWPVEQQRAARQGSMTPAQPPGMQVMQLAVQLSSAAMVQPGGRPSAPGGGPPPLVQMCEYRPGLQHRDLRTASQALWSTLTHCHKSLLTRQHCLEPSHIWIMRAGGQGGSERYHCRRQCLTGRPHGCVPGTLLS